VLLAIADEVTENLDAGFSRKVIDGGLVARAESLMWLWILGAYEVVRTMCQAKACFAQRAFDELNPLKKRLTAVRMPAAKMERPGVKIPVTSNRSPAAWDVSRRDILINDPEAEAVFARDLLAEFDRVLSSIRPEDILGRHEDGYKKNAD